jgi:hypothetical protein
MNIRTLYLYLFAFIGLLIVVIGMVQLVNLGLNVYVFDGADRYEYARYPVFEEEAGLSDEERAALEAEQEAIDQRELLRQRQRQLASAIAELIVGVPLYLYHWGIIARELKTK